MSQNEVTVSVFDLPQDYEWSELDEVPRELLTVCRLYSATVRDEVTVATDDDKSLHTIEQFYNAYDALVEADIVVAKDEETEQVVGIAVMSVQRGTPFLEAIAVDRANRRRGVGSACLRSILIHAAKYDDELRLRAQPSAAHAFFSAEFGATQLDESPKGQVYMTIPTNRSVQ